MKLPIFGKQTVLKNNIKKNVIMETKNILLILLLLFAVTVVAASCNEKAKEPNNPNEPDEPKVDYPTDEIPYKTCDCFWVYPERPFEATGTLQLSGVYLFRDSIPRQMRIQMLADNRNNDAVWIIFDSKSNHTWIDIFPPKGDMRSHGRICNFPDFAKEWIIPQNGLKVDIEGIMHETCIGGTDDHVRFDLVLTNLKRKQK